MLSYPTLCGKSAEIFNVKQIVHMYRGADKSLARPTSGCILFDGQNISFDAGLVIYIYIYIYICIYIYI